MGSLKVDVKWGKEVFKNIEIDANEPPLMFKNQLFSLTGVAPERQKIMVKGGLLKDDTEWAKAGIKPGQKLMMMGTADVVPTAPTGNQVFMEDLPEEEQDVTGLAKYGAGLQNMGNTCYMNSTLQCFYGVRELRTAMDSYTLPQGSSSQPDHRLAHAAKGVFEDLQRLSKPVPPLGFWMMLRQAYPQFDAQISRGGQTGFQQQDAEECWTNLMHSLRTSVKDPSDATMSIVDKLFGVKLRTSLKCEESGEVIEEDTTALSLKCNISIEVNDLSEGLRLGLKDDREKNSEALGRSALFAGGSKITELPPYLTVQMVRFFFKADVQQKAKILRKVNFPMVLDTYEFASEELKARLAGPRSSEAAVEEEADQASKRQKREAQAKEDKEAADKAAAKKAAKAGTASETPAASDATTPSPPAGTAAPAPDAASSAAKPDGDAELVDAQPSGTSAAELRAKYAGQPTGRYDLTAVLTHKGRSADSGHYVAWVKQPDGTWVQFDDEELIVRKQDEVLALSGGGDWHMAYLLLYRQRMVQA
mmetsp:Transcript_13021/g.39438  ORF Transcript_13021/g.39438 Transcript_13021/m.39438 type:complete len:533 (-) Transcript_13021:267-1865(-)|eukprot:CAMPEP_0206137148 /NCGR_PEP_ID=MMETSP1473-20131121/2312_1 /ASSEMBLY_ACC=CAM_ASM_001109 /TAXON_ID=1461547 /ORGANISM="Stichococcus sp, Strain RCC1054" /LENGTH=532 /DNA_ID=CAMNT_0053530085 /DNA_START=23 /DNA_END=1621 /DNA_ORIENTATION=+